MITYGIQCTGESIYLKYLRHPTLITRKKYADSVTPDVMYHIKGLQTDADSVTGD